MARGEGPSGAGLPPGVFVAKPPQQLALGIALIVLVPSGNILVRWMSLAACGVHVEAMRTHRADMKT